VKVELGGYGPITSAVIPAQAGIHPFKMHFYQSHWIPAYAGMTRLKM
jgi:hypothetical protein